MSNNLTAQLIDLINRYKNVEQFELIDLDERRIEMSAAYLCHLVEKNKVMNLTGITDPREMVILHLLDSWTLLPLIKKYNPQTILDIGSGAGLPGIPLKICLPEVDFLLVDSLNKRIKFLEEVIDSLDLPQISAQHARVEDVQFLRQYRAGFDLAVARAVANLSTLLEYALPTIQVGGHFIALKGPSIEEELKTAGNALEILGGKIVSVESIALPENTGERRIVVVEKVKATPKKYPRPAGKPRKQPL